MFLVCFTLWQALVERGWYRSKYAGVIVVSWAGVLNSTKMAKLQADLPKSPQPKHGTIRCDQLAADAIPGSRNTAHERNGMPSPLIDFTQDPELGSIRLIACDMDCTLLADDKTQPENMPELIERLHRAGVLFCPASGRPGPTLQLMFPEHRHEMAFCADNGAHIIYQDEPLYKELLDPAVYREIAAATEAEGTGTAVLCAFDKAYVPESGRVHHEAIGVYYKSIEYVDSIEDLDVEANKFTIYFPERNSRSRYEETFGPAFGERLDVACAGEEWLDFMNKGVNKGAGLRHLCDRLGIDIADAAAVGDTYNDIEMLEAAGHSFVVANAAEHMHDHARYLIPSNNDRGVAALIEAILAAKGC